MYGPALAEESTKVEPDFLLQQTPGYQKPWRGDVSDGQGADNVLEFLHSKKKRKTIYGRIQVNPNRP